MHLSAESSVTPPPITAPLEGLLAGLRLGLGVGTGDPEADLEALSRVDDWNAVAALARRHRVAFPLLKGMQARAAGLASVSASGIEPRLKRTRERTVHRGLAQVAALKRATGLLAAADIPCLVLKGLPLGQRLYGHPLARSSQDIDLLVSPQTFQAAERVLLENGWRRVKPSFPETPARNRWYGRFRHEHVLAGPGGSLDLHRRLSHNPFYIDVPFESLLAGSIQVEIGALSFRTLGQEDDLVYLMCHGARHYWKKLVWLCDVAVVLASMEPERLERVSARCRQAGLSSILASTLLLCGAALHVRLPRGAAPLPAGGRRAAWIARFSERTWCDEDAARFSGGFDWAGQKVIGLIAKPDSRTVLHEIASVFVGPRDWGRLDLPDRLFYLYFPLRPLLWATRRKDGRRAPPAATAGAGPRFGQSVKAVRAFVRAPVAAKAMALEAALFLLLARMLVAHVPMRHWRRWLVTAEGPASAGRPPADPHVAFSAGDPERPAPAGEHPARTPQQRLPRRVARIVRRVARHVPFPAVCLPQAMALQWMLRRRRIASRLFFGARRKAQDPGLDFHAWLTVGGECVIGGGEVETYAALPPFEGIGPRPG